MSDYTPFAQYYDLIMTSGYYDYDAIAASLAAVGGVNDVLEIGVGTGLILERLARRRPELRLTGIDLTAAMLDIAAGRLSPYPQISLHRQNVVSLSLPTRYDLAFSYGGVWYFVPDPAGGGFSMISHIRSEAENRQGLEHLAASLTSGGRLMLGFQPPHVDYDRPVANGMNYSQRITEIPDGFRKHYALTDAGRTVMEQTTDYRVFSFADSLELLAKCGFDYRPPEPVDSVESTGSAESESELGLFLELTKR